MSGGAPGDARLAALLAAIEEAKALSSRRDAARDDALATVDASALAARLEEAERENDELRERVAELTALNDDAAAELLQDAAELAAALANAEDLEEEAEALRVLNARLADAAKEVAAMVVADDASSSSAETHLEKLRAEADSARAALATAEHRAKAERDALLSRVRALEVDLAEAEAEPVGGEAEDRDALASAREKIEGLSALAARRGDALLQAEAAAASAAAEVPRSKQLETAAAAAAAAAASATAAIRARDGYGVDAHRGGIRRARPRAGARDGGDGGRRGDGRAPGARARRRGARGEYGGRRGARGGGGARRR